MRQNNPQNNVSLKMRYVGFERKTVAPPNTIIEPDAKRENIAIRPSIYIDKRKATKTIPTKAIVAVIKSNKLKMIKKSIIGPNSINKFRANLDEKFLVLCSII